MIVSRFPYLFLKGLATAAALAALGWCADLSHADEPVAPSATSSEQTGADVLLAVLQPPDDGPRRPPEGGARSGGPDRRPDEGARPGQRGRGGGDRPPPGDRPGQRGPDDRPPGDRGPDGPRADEPRPDGPPRGPQDQPRPGARSGGGRGFGAEGPQFAPPGAPMSGPGGLDARIARLEQKLDTVLRELRALRSERTPPRYADRGPGPGQGYGSYGMRGGAPRGPIGPPSFDREWRDGDRFGPPARRLDGPPPEMRRERMRWEGPPPRSRGGGGARDGGPPRSSDRDRRGDDDLIF